MRSSTLVLSILCALLVAAPAASAAGAGGTPARLSVLVTNDDGVGAPGIDALVQALRKQPALTVTVVAPAKNQSGTGGKTTPGALKATPARTKSGYPATAVAGYPADTITYALAHQFKRRKPDLVVSGINFGQNIGPFVGLSGTVGAALAAGKRGIPALATSQGLGNPANFPAGVRQTIAWLTANRAHLHKGRVVSINTPTCSKGRVRGILPATVAASFGSIDPFAAVDCSTAAKPASGADVAEFSAGYATIGVLRR
ncbi:MAG TPA: 5'/3'-nucleotidase SurE [Solirubrobacteraceae bacterium]